MPTYNPKQLGEPEIIREINPTVLCAFLKPFESYLRTRGLEVKEPSRIDNAAIEKLVDILINPTMKTPQRLLNAVFYVEEMSTPLAADSLLKLAIQAGMPFDENENHTLADVVMQVWLFDSKMVEAQHAWQTWKTPRRMECFQPVQSMGIAPITITEDRLNLAIKDAGDWFAEHNRGRKLFMTPRIINDEIQISIRRGDPFRRKPTIDDDGMDTVTFREARKDSMIYDLSEEVLMLSSSLKSTYPMYCRIFGHLLFDDPSILESSHVIRSRPFRNLARMLCHRARSMPSKRSSCSTIAFYWVGLSIATSSMELMIFSRISSGVAGRFKPKGRWIVRPFGSSIVTSKHVARCRCIPAILRHTHAMKTHAT